MRVSILVLLVLAVFVFTSSSLADIPKVINYQGKVTDSGGTPVPDGNYQMRFRVMDAPAGGTTLWDSGFQTVPVSGGVFNVLLGESPQPALDIEFAEDYWLLVTFEGTNQTPRQQFASAGYAYMASGLVPGTQVSGAVTSGNFAAIYCYNTATSGTNYGVYGRSSSTSGRGVYGYASATSGTNYGIHGRSNSTSGMGVYGFATATSGITYGGRFETSSTSGRAIYGYASATSGTNYGVRGQNSSTSGRGVSGYASANSGTNYGVHGATNSPSGYGVYYSGGLGGTGSKSCVVKTSQGPTLLYCQESPENWFEDFGEGQLVDGHAHIDLDALFLETVTIDHANPMKVFVELHDVDCNGVAVKKGLSGFDVMERHGGTSNGSFDYRVVAKRKGFEEKRLDYCKAAETDSYLYPELREKELLADKGYSTLAETD